MPAAVQEVLDAINAGTPAHKLETHQLDFKEAKVNLKEAWNDLTEAAVCFANSSGGRIIVGVADRKGGSEAFVGCDLEPSKLRSRIHQLTNPSLLVEVETLKHGGVTLLIITVPEGLEVYSTSKGYTYHRISSECVPMTPVDVTRLSDERRGIDWSAGPSELSVHDIDPFALRYCRRLLENSTDSSRTKLANLSDLDLLRVLKATTGGPSLTRSGALMLCKSAADLVVYQHRRTQSGEPDAVLRVGGPLLLAFEEVMQMIRTRQGITPVTLPSGQQLQIEDYPSAVVREGLVNALVHGDWRTNVPVHVEHSPQYLSITSPGPLVSGITVYNILTRGSKARFPALTAAFRLLGLAEEVGQGVDRMFREMIRSGRDVPLLREDADQLTVQLRGEPPQTRITKFIATLPAEEQDDTDTLLIVRYLCDRKTVKASDLEPLIQRTIEEAQAVLRRLSAEPVSILEPTRGTLTRRLPAYRLRAEVVAQLGPAVAYHGRAVDEIDRKVVEHLKDYGEINNRTVQRLFDVDVYQARDILQNLVGRELIVRSSSQTRGSAVKYSVGPAFPGKVRRRAGRSSSAKQEHDEHDEERLF